MSESGKSWQYLTIYDKLNLNCSRVCNVHYYIRDNRGMNYRFKFTAAVTYGTDEVLETMFKVMLSQVT